MKWFRFYSEFVDDPKVAMMSDSDQLLWVKALCLASESPCRGTILLSDDEIIWKLRISLEVWKHAIDKFRAKGMIEHCEGGYRIINWNKRQQPENPYGRLPANQWSVIRKRIFARDNYTCQYCGATDRNLHCDHVLPISRGGSNDDENLVTACEPCNCSKHNKTIKEWIESMQG